MLADKLPRLVTNNYHNIQLNLYTQSLITIWLNEHPILPQNTWTAFTPAELSSGEFIPTLRTAANSSKGWGVAARLTNPLLLKKKTSLLSWLLPLFIIFSIPPPLTPLPPTYTSIYIYCKNAPNISCKIFENSPFYTWEIKIPGV